MTSSIHNMDFKGNFLDVQRILQVHKNHNHHTYYYLFATILKAVNTSTKIKTGFYKTTRLILLPCGLQRPNKTLAVYSVK